MILSIKRAFKVYDENYNESFEVFGKAGILPHDSSLPIIYIVEPYEIAEDALESTLKNKDGDYLLLSKAELNKFIKERIDEFAKILFDETFEAALCQADEDEFIEISD